MEITGTHTVVATEDVVSAMCRAKSVIVVPGYGLAVAKARSAQPPPRDAPC
jgi:NAD/NADP transhydrogenase beta subunit